MNDMNNMKLSKFWDDLFLLQDYNIFIEILPVNE